MTKTNLILFLRTYWKYIAVVVVVLIIVSVALSTYKGISSYFKDYNTLKAANALLDERESKSRAIIEEQLTIIKMQDSKIDSLNLALSLKRERIIKIESDVKLLKGDTTAIVDNLARVLTR